jgi:hypothetical protein
MVAEPVLESVSQSAMDAASATATELEKVSASESASKRIERS